MASDIIVEKLTIGGIDMRGPMGQNFEMRQKLKEPKPKSLKEVPKYLYKTITKFF